MVFHRRRRWFDSHPYAGGFLIVLLVSIFFLLLALRGGAPLERALIAVLSGLVAGSVAVLWLVRRTSRRKP
jgi:hypothetical protein